MVASAGSRPARVPALTKYEVLEELGHGGMATVYRAHDKRLGRDVAIKVLHPHLRESREIAHRFEAEAKAVAKLRHRNIVEVFDVSSADEDEQYLVVEFVRGQTLRKLLQKAGALPPEVAAALALELLGALAHAHSAGVVHRDVKPENVLLEHRSVDSPPTTSSPTPTPLPTTPSSAPVTASPPSAAASRRTPVDSNRGERIAVKLTDFGIAKLLDAQGVTSTGQVLGSPAHMAPEQIEGGDVDGRADVFGMGVLLYECMVGHLPFEGNNPAQVLRRVLDGIYPSAERERPTVGKIYSQILDRALARQAEDRYDNAEQMREALSTELLRLGVAAPRTELEAYFDDPEGWTAEHEKRLIGKLCTLGGDARKRGDAVAAAADYNRALAYAPNDPQLLRIVASMHRAEARMRIARRATPLVFGALALGFGAFFVAKALKGSPVVPTPQGPSTDGSSMVAKGPPSATPSAKPVLTSPAPSERPTVVLGAAKPPLVSTADAGMGKKRSVTFASLQPQYGVVMNVDGVRGPDPGPGVTFMLPDEKQHSLSFTCQDRDGNELCVPKTIPVPPGDTEQTLDVQLTILPAKLTVEGDPGKSYGIEEVPNITLASGVAAEIPMRAGQAAQTVTIYDRSDPEKRKKQALRAGRQHVVSFKNP